MTSDKYDVINFIIIYEKLCFFFLTKLKLFRTAPIPYSANDMKYRESNTAEFQTATRAYCCLFESRRIWEQ